MSPSYRARKRAGLVRAKPRRTTPAIRREIRRKYFRLRMKQLELALEYDVSQSTIARCIANEAYRK
jgi:hypothetical protein